jgi:hypothetical protein
MPLPTSRRPHLEVADICRGEAVTFLEDHRLSTEQRRVFADLQACRTAVMGGHVRVCNHCDHREISYNSCRNRHCPKCQASARADWLLAREAELLPVPYFHLVFTLPAEIAALALQNKRLLYGMLFQAASETLSEVAARKLGVAQLGILAVLHTWGQNLMHHPHLHCVVSGGGLSQDADRWIASREDYFLPVRLLSYVFRQQYGRLLRQAFERGELEFHGQLTPLSQPHAFRSFLAAATGRDWVVFAKRPFREPACVLKYLARYTHRVAISNGRLVAYRDGQVTFRYRDYAQQGRRRTMTLAAGEFLRRFLLHVLPTGLMRIRHYGYLANRHRHAKLAICRRLLGCEPPGPAPADVKDCQASSNADETETTIPCPACCQGRLEVQETFERQPRVCLPLPPAANPPWQDSS